MIFQKEKVYTALNADEVKVGSKGILANKISWLKEQVEEEGTDKIKGTYIRTLFNIKTEDYDKRFAIEDFNRTSFLYFYLIEEPKEKKFRPYRNTDEMVEDFCKRYNSYSGATNMNNPMYRPLIWLKHKNDDTEKFLVVNFRPQYVVVFGSVEGIGKSSFVSLKDLSSEYEYLDGSPCGKEEN